ncbi:AraC family transcriptional regulator [Corallococcus terminator]|uniref:AraC family transcriptional regulator n=1 Tax=Corallococcus terminator TaxID=2316733 RepID=A0A3A8IVU2_9BACT|nr:helix-turn-helix domain-containing protein [Corallococcus terminator]RKG87335.1 AraC family transcriptional regulator [Corallococcus terminator]
MVASSTGPARGLLYPRPDARHFAHARLLPAEDLRPWVEHFWAVRWDLREQPPFLQQNLTHPSVHWTFQDGTSRIAGVHSGRFSLLLEGLGGVFGIKFRPGGFFRFVKTPVSALTERTMAPAPLLGPEALALEAAILATDVTRDANAERVALAEAFLRARLPAADPNVAGVQGMVTRILEDRAVTKVEDLLTPGGPGLRTVQRLFRRYVGVSPKWVIQRYRLHEAAERLKEVPPPELATLALELGYFDQAHFIRDFRRVVGCPPAEYARRAPGPVTPARRASE